jgi:anti-anti-sigma factor
VAPQVFKLSGEIDLHTVGDLEPQLRAWLSETDSPIIDMTDVNFVDSTALNMLVRLADEHLPLTLRGVTPPVKRLFALAGLNELFRFE